MSKYYVWTTYCGLRAKNPELQILGYKTNSQEVKFPNHDVTITIDKDTQEIEIAAHPKVIGETIFAIFPRDYLISELKILVECNSRITFGEMKVGDLLINPAGTLSEIIVEIEKLSSTMCLLRFYAVSDGKIEYKESTHDIESELNHTWKIFRKGLILQDAFR